MILFRQFSLAALIATTPAYAGDDDLLKMVSSDTDLALHLPNTAKTRANWEKSPLKGIYENDEIKPRVEEAFAEMMNFEDIEDRDVAKSMRENLEKIFGFMEGEVLLTMSLPTATEELVKKFREADEESVQRTEFIFDHFGILLLGEVGASGDDFNSSVKSFLDAAGKAIEEAGEDSDETHSYKEKTIDGVKVTAWHVDGPDLKKNVLHWGVVGETSFITMGNYNPADFIAEIKNGHKSSLESSEFLFDGASDLQVFGDLSDVMAALKMTAEVGLAETGMKAQLQIDIESGWKALGFDGLKNFGFSFDISQPEIVSRTKMDYPETGVLSYFLPKDPINKPSIHAHKGALSTAQGNYDLPGLYDEIMDMIKAVSPMGPMAVGMQLSQLEKQIGIKLRDDLLAALGKKVEYMQFKGDTAEETAMSIAAIIALKDQAKFEGTLKTMLTGMGMETAKEEFMEQTLYKIPLPSAEGGDHIVYTFHDGDVIFGLDSVGTVKSILKQIKNPKETIWQTDLLADHKDLLKPGAVTLSMGDVGAQIDNVFSTVGDLSDDEDQIDFSKIKIPYGYNVTTSWRKDGIFEGKSVIFVK